MRVEIYLSIQLKKIYSINISMNLLPTNNRQAAFLSITEQYMKVTTNHHDAGHTKHSACPSVAECYFCVH